MPSSSAARSRVIGRYALFDEIASGGMASVHLGRLLGPVGFARTVAIKRLHPQFAKDPEFVSMFLDEARLAARIQHPNVVQTLDVVAEGGELFLVMDFVRGETFGKLIRASRAAGAIIPLPILSAIVAGALHGLHAAHEARDETGDPLGIVHRDVSPQNILVGTDGVARVLDFGVAKAAGRIQTTQEGQLKGKMAYMAPEQLRANEVTRRTDIYAASVVLWEGITGRRLFDGDNQAFIYGRVLEGDIEPPSRFAKIPIGLEAVVMRGLAMAPQARHATARDMAIELERAVRPAPPNEVGEWVQSIASAALEKRAAVIRSIEKSSRASTGSLVDVLGDTGPNRALDGAAAIDVTLESDRTPTVSLPPGSGMCPRTATTAALEPSSGILTREPRYPVHERVSQPSSISVSADGTGTSNPRKKNAKLLPLGILVAASTAFGLVALFLLVAPKHESVPMAPDPAALAKSPETTGTELASTPPTNPPASVATPDPKSTGTMPSGGPSIPTSPPSPVAGPTKAVEPSHAVVAKPPATTDAKVPSTAAAKHPATDPVKRVVKPAAPEPKAVTPPSAKSTKADCDPPWTRDASGVRVYKKNCIE
ncbi:MAG: protein kinase [Polyangiaceae bacterium]